MIQKIIKYRPFLFLYALNLIVTGFLPYSKYHDNFNEIIITSFDPIIQIPYFGFIILTTLIISFKNKKWSYTLVAIWFCLNIISTIGAYSDYSMYNSNADFIPLGSAVSQIMIFGPISLLHCMGQRFLKKLTLTHR